MMRRSYNIALMTGLILSLVPGSQALAFLPFQQQANDVAYVSPDGYVAGKLDTDTQPFTSIAEALEAGASELRIAAGTYEEGQLDFATGGTVTLRSWDGGLGAGKRLDTDALIELRAHVRIDKGTRVVLAEGAGAFRLEGNLLVPDGELDVRGHTLEIEGDKMHVAARSKITDSALASTSQNCGGGLAFSGGNNTEIFYETSADNDYRATTVTHILRKDSGGRTSFNTSGTPATNLPPLEPNFLDILAMPCMTVEDNEGGQENGGEQGIDLLAELDILDIEGSYAQFDGEFLMSGVSSIGGGATQPVRQTVQVGFSRDPNDFTQANGEFFTSGGDVEVFGDFCLGCTDVDDQSASDALFSLDFNGEHTVVGDFRVNADTDPSDENVDEENRNRYFLGGECGVLREEDDRGGLFLNGDYWFEGTGDRFDDLDFLELKQGLRGTIFFIGDGDEPQNVWQRQDEDAFFCDVVMASRSDDNEGILLQSDAWQNEDGRLTLEHGVIDVGAVSSDWIVQNPGLEKDLKERNNSARGEGVVDLGSRDSYINGEVERRVEFGNATGGVVTGGYLFPVGASGEEGGPVGTRDVDFFRPLLLQFPDDLGRSELARVDYRQDLASGQCTLPPGGMVVDAFVGERRDNNDDNVITIPEEGMLTLDTVSDQFWQLEFDRIPSFDPNVRVEASELPNVFDIKSLRLIQWDCDCTNPRLAGVYDTEQDGTIDDPSFAVNDYINGVPNLTQEGVQVKNCNIIGIASNFLINPINLPPIGDVAPVQVINATGEDLDVRFQKQEEGFPEIYVRNLRGEDATHFVPFPSGTHQIDVFPGGNGATNPLAMGTHTLPAEPGQFIIEMDRSGNVTLIPRTDAQRVSQNANEVDFSMYVHEKEYEGINLIGRYRLASQDSPLGSFAFSQDTDDNGFTEYTSVPPEALIFELVDGDTGMQINAFKVDLSDKQGQAQTFAVRNTNGGGKQASFKLLTFSAGGAPITSDNVTSLDADADLPNTFALHGNYPNPFNPSTTIQFDLPETAMIHIEVVDLLGRTVLVTSEQQVKAGANQSMKLDASRLASGTYFYRLIAQSQNLRMIDTGRMVLVK